MRFGPVPENLCKEVEEKRNELVSTLADVDDHMADLFLEEKVPTVDELKVKDIFSKVYISRH